MTITVTKRDPRKLLNNDFALNKWSHTFREEHKLRSFQNTKLSRILGRNGRKREGKLYNEEPRDWCKKIHAEFYQGDLIGRDTLGNLSVDMVI